MRHPIYVILTSHYARFDGNSVDSIYLVGEGGDNMRSLTAMDWIALILVIIGALNWGAVGLFDFNFVEAIFGVATIITRIIYILVGLAGLYLVFASPSWKREVRS